MNVPQVPSISAQELARLNQAGAQVIDVREPFELMSGTVPGARHIPMHLIPLKLDEIRPSSDVYVVCESGNRSWQVAAFLARHGHTAYNVHGGMAAWRAGGLPVERPAPERTSQGGQS